MFFVLISEAYGMMQYYDEIESELQRRKEGLQKNNINLSHPTLEGDVWIMPVRFERCV